MGLFRKYVAISVPNECKGMEVKTESSTCTGEKSIGFYDRNAKKLLYSELVRNEDDIIAFCDKYGINRENVR